MLILTRRAGESVLIGNDVVITIRGISGNKVRVGIKAPATTRVHREEFYRRLKARPSVEIPSRLLRQPVTNSNELLAIVTSIPSPDFTVKSVAAAPAQEAVEPPQSIDLPA